ncbi:MAG: response regulator transcription factor [Bacteroidota bacterium]
MESNTTYRLLLVEDDQTMAYLVRDALQREGYQVDWAEDGAVAFSRFMNHDYHLCILDVMLPKQDGFALAAQIRQLNTEVPLIFLTARHLQEDRLKGLRLGADDYIAKPFSMEELQLRIEGLLRRTFGQGLGQNKNGILQVGDFILDVPNQRLKRSAEQLDLTYRETRLLSLFFGHPNQLLERNWLEQIVWHDEGLVVGRSLDVFVSRLRKILSADPKLKLVNVRAKGYRLELKNGE